MRFARFLLLVFVLLFSFPALGQQTQNPQTQSVATKDPQAVTVVTQALDVSGGTQAMAAIADYTASGNATYYQGMDQSIQASVTIRGRGLGQLRIDTSLPSGVRSESISGTMAIKYEDGFVKQLFGQAPMDAARVILPFLQLRSALTGARLSLIYNGLANIDGLAAYDIRVQRALPQGVQTSLINENLTIDYFIDPSTFHVVMMQDVIPSGALRQIRYNDLRVVSGLLVPFSISETIQRQTIRLIQLSQVSFNTGLLDTDFQL